MHVDSRIGKSLSWSDKPNDKDSDDGQRNQANAGADNDGIGIDQWAIQVRLVSAEKFHSCQLVWSQFICILVKEAAG